MTKTLSQILSNAKEETERRRRFAEMADEYRGSFRKFIQASWPQVEPSKPFIQAWHIDAIAEHAQAAYEGQIPNLLVTVPPGAAKSVIMAVDLPAWIWTRDPGFRSTYLSYEDALSTRDSVRCRDLMASLWYQETFQPTWRFASDQNEKTYYVNTAKGFRVSGAGTGWRSHMLVYDDPLNAKDRHSDLALAKVIDNWENVLFNRFVDLTKAIRIVIMQRLGDRDLAGHWLRKGSVEHLKIPLEYDPTRSKVTSIGWEDPRKDKNVDKVMCPELFPPAVVEDLKSRPEAWCTPGYTPILMADWSEKLIEDVRTGDELVGFVRGSGTVKASLEKCTVTAVHSSVRPVYRFRLSSGREVHCTRDHKWYSSGHDTKRAQYRALSMRSKLACVYTPPPPIANTEEQRAYDWLGGILDGEGSCETRGPITISQSSANPEIQAAIDANLAFLKIPFHRWEGKRRPKNDQPHWAERGHWHLNGGRSTKMRLLAHCKMYKRDRFVRSLWYSSRYLSENIKLPSTPGHKADHRVCSIELIGEMKVYGLTTTTGNYVAWGFASQNSSQYQQEPNAEGGGILKASKWNYWQPAGLSLPPVRVKMPNGDIQERVAIDLPDSFDVLLQSWDCTFKDLKTSDFVCGQVHGARGARRFILDQTLKRMGIVETMAAIREMTGRHPKAHLKLVEDKANGTAVVEMLQADISGMVLVNPEGGKIPRAVASSPELEAGNWYLPHPQIASWVGNPENPTEGGFLASSVLFPFGAHDDDVDAWTQGAKRIRDEKIGGVFGVSEADLRVDPFDFDPKWPRVYGMAVTWYEVAAVWMCRRPETDQYYAYAEYSVPPTSPVHHAAEIIKPGDWIDGYITAKDAGRDEKDGYALVDKYRKLKLKISTVTPNEEAMILDLQDALSTGKLKLFGTLSRTLDEYRMYRRDEKTGKLPERNDGLIKALCVAWSCRTKASGPPQPAKPDRLANMKSGPPQNGWMGA